MKINYLKLFDSSTIKKINFRSDINGLRAIAVLSVVFYHADFYFFKGGWLGVDIFFVISGYLISNNIISDLNRDQFTFKKFYLRRATRILPALISTVVFSLFLSIFSFNSVKLQEFTESLIASLTFLSNFYFSNLDFYTYDPIKYSFFVHTWSLSIEEQFYIIFPLLIFALFRYSKRNIFLAITAISIFSIYLNISTISNQKFYFLQFRLWEFFLGVLVMIASTHFSVKKLDIPGVLLILLSIYFFDDNWINDIEPKLICLFGVAIILLSDSDKSLFSQFSNFKFISTIGLSSYSMYLLHQPLFAFSRIMSDSLNRELHIYSSFIIIIFLFYISNLSYTQIELKFLNSQNTKDLQIFLTRSIVPIIFFIAFVIFTQGFSFLHTEKDFSAESGGVKFQYEGELLGNTTGKPTFVVVGDSHANHFLKQLDEQAKNYNISFYQYTYPNCLSLVNFTNTYKFGLNGYENCVNLFQKALNKASELNVPLVYSNSWQYDLRNNINGDVMKWSDRLLPFDLIRDELMLSIKKNSDMKIIIIGKTIGSNIIPFGKPVNCSKISGFSYLKIYNLKLKDSFGLCNENKQVVENIEINNVISKSIEEFDNFKFINPAKLYCLNGVCLDYLQGEYIYIDSHLSYIGSTILVDSILKEFGLKEK